MKRWMLELIGYLEVWMEWLLGWKSRPAMGKRSILNVALAIGERNGLIGSVFVHKGFEGYGGPPGLRGDTMMKAFGNRLASTRHFSDYRNSSPSLVNDRPAAS